MLALAMLASILAAATPVAGSVPITWKGKTYAVDTLPATLSEGQKTVATAWEPWARENGYRIDFDAEGRVLLISPKDGTGPDARMKVIAKTAAWFDALLPLPARAPGAVGAGAGAPPTPAAPATPGGEIPEDPEAPPPNAPPTIDPRAKKAAGTTVWGGGGGAPDSETAVMLVVHDEKDFASALQSLAKRYPALKAWAAGATKHTGFVLEEPLCGAYVENASGQEEWNPDHELLNRVGQLLLLRRYSQQPYWLVQGIGWEAEIHYDGALYCFPYRDEFVGVGEHSGWPVELKNQFKDRASKPLKFDEVASWKRGRFDAGPAHIAWGLIHYVATSGDATKLPLVLEDLRAFRDEDDRKKTSATTWERIPGYEIPAARQQEIFEKHFGADFTKSATAWFRKQEEPKRMPEKSGLQRAKQ